MQGLPPEALFQIWGKLPVEDILNLCRTNVEFKQICDNDYTWNYLLKRDFGIDYTGYDPKIKYITTFTEDRLLKRIKNKVIINLLYYDGIEVGDLYTIIGDNRQQLFEKVVEDYKSGQIYNNFLEQMIDDYITDNLIENLSPENIENMYDLTDELRISETRADHFIL